MEIAQDGWECKRDSMASPRPQNTVKMITPCCGLETPVIGLRRRA